MRILTPPLCLSSDDGYLGEWSEWLCEATCGISIGRRKRECLPDPDYPYPLDCPQNCPAEREEEKQCDNGCCPREF